MRDPDLVIEAPSDRTMRQLHRFGYRCTVSVALCAHDDVGMSLYRTPKAD